MYRREFEANLQSIVGTVNQLKRTDMVEFGQSAVMGAIRKNLRTILVDAGVPAADLPESEEDLQALVAKHYHKPASKAAKKKARAKAKAAQTNDPGDDEDDDGDE